MNNLVVNKIQFPEFTGVSCNMMPFIQGDSNSLPEEYKPYASIIEENFIEKGEIGFLTIQESFVEGGNSQRGYNSIGSDRNVHIEVGRVQNENCWGNSWGKGHKTLLNDDTKFLIANSVSNTCKVWDTEDKSYTEDGDLSAYIDKYPEDTGMLLQEGEVAKMSIFTPHECITQKESGNRQFFRIVGKGVNGREDYFTINPLLNLI